MFVLKSTLELMRQKDEEISELKEEISDLESELKQERRRDEMLEEKNELKLEREKDKIRKTMQKSLVESDLQRVEAVAKLNTYIDMDTKEERKHIQNMLEKAIEALGSKNVTINTK